MEQKKDVAFKAEAPAPSIQQLTREPQEDTEVLFPVREQEARQGEQESNQRQAGPEEQPQACLQGAAAQVHASRAETGDHVNLEEQATSSNNAGRHNAGP